jgi:hypothetical protein
MMATPADKVFEETMNPEMIEVSDRRADALLAAHRDAIRTMRRLDLPQPDLRHDDEDDRLKEQLLLVARIGWHCPRELGVMRRVEGFVDPSSSSYDETFAGSLREINDNWFYDLGYDPDADYAVKRLW